MALPINGIFSEKIVNSSFTYNPRTVYVPNALNYSQVSMILTSGAATFQAAASNGGAVAVIDMVLNVPITLTSSNNMPIGGFIVTATSGTVQFVGTFLTSL